MRRAIGLVILALILILAGCQTVTFQGIQVMTKVPTHTVIKDFTITIPDPHLFNGLAPMGQPDQKIFTYIQDEIKKLGGDAAIDVEIDYGYTTIDMLLNVVTSFIYSPRTITVTGTVVKYK